MPTSHMRQRRRTRRRSRQQTFETLEARRVLDSTVVFNEVMYNPAGGEESLEWIELHNQMAVDMNMSGWSLREAVDFSFPEGTILGGGDYLVVAASPEGLQAAAGVDDAMGPFSRQLANSGERIELRNHTGRLMDVLEYDDNDRWTSIADGTGASLAKIRSQAGTAQPENWTFSSQMQGTPGEQNLTVDHPTRDRLRINEVAAAGDGPLWIELHNHSDEPLPLTGHYLTLQRPHPAIYRFEQDTLPADGYLVVRADQLPFGDLVEGDRIVLRAAEGELIVDAAEFTSRLQGRSAEHDGRWQFPAAATPGAPNQFAFHDQIVVNEVMYHARPQYSTPGVFAADTVMEIDTTWRFDQSGQDRGTQWREPGYDDSQWDAGQGLFFRETADLSAPKNTPLEIGVATYYFRTTFEWDGADVPLGLRHIVDDGAVFYINGVEFDRFNMADGDVDYQTLASRSVRDARLVGPVTIPAEHLMAGTNTLAVEVHQRNASSSDVVFGADLIIQRQIVPSTPFLESDEEWIELYNRSDQAVDLSGWRLSDAVRFEFPAGTMLGPDQYVVVARDAQQLAAAHPGINVVGEFSGRLSDRDELLRLFDDTDNLADELHYFDGGRWPEFADGGGASLELRDPNADNSRGEVWSNSLETSRSSWNHYSYTATVNPIVFDPPINFHEFVMGLIGPGEVWLDNISVVENPAGEAAQLIQNGTFEGDTPGTHAEKWRLVGTHETSEVIVDPDNAANKVLRMVAEARMNYLSNHAETTLANGARVVDGQTYQISYDARWIMGTPQLHTELYYKDAAKTTILSQPDVAGTPGARNSTWHQNLGPTYAGLRHDPPIPSPTDPVTVTVIPEDPDGVAQVELNYVVDRDDQFVTVPMTLAADNTYVATIPPQSRNDVVQFFVQATDGQGAVSTFPAAGPESRALYKVTTNLNLDNDRHDFRLIMTPDDIRELQSRTNMIDNNRQGATVIYNGTEIFYDIGARLKGSMFSRQNMSTTGYNVRFNPDQPFRGVHETVRFDQNGENEILVKYFTAAIGNPGGSYDDVFQLTTPSGQGGGPTFTFLAAHDDVFLREQFENGQDGTLFKFEGIRVMQTTVDRNDPESLKLYQPIGWVSQFDIQDLGSDKELYRWPFLIHNNRDRDDYDPIIALAKAFSLQGDALERAAAELLDADQWMSTFAIMSLFGIGDAYSQGNPHNLNLYQRPSDNKLLAFPWDWDFVFSQQATAPLHGNKNIGKLIERPPFEHLFLGHLHHMITTQFNRAAMQHWTENFGSLLGTNLRGLLSSIDRRGSFVLGRLPSEVFFQIGTDDSNVESTELVNASTQAQVLIPSEENGGDQLGESWTAVDFVPSPDWQTGPSAIGFEATPDDFEDLIKFDVLPMYLNNASAYIRVPFQWDGDPATADRLRLRMQYDDGFVAYLNGKKVAEANAPSSPQWNSNASASHRDSEAVEFVEFNLGDHIDALRSGDNVLAIQGLNRSATGNDFLIVPELIVQKVEDRPVQELTVDTSSVTLDGKGWINVRQIQLEGAEEPLELDWIDTTTWRATVPLQPGLNPLVLQAIDFSGEVTAVDRINVTSTVARPLLEHLRVSELMYHSADPTAGEQAAGFDGDDDFDFIELVNTSSTETLDLTNVQWESGVQFRFPDVQLAPQQRVVVAADLQAFEQRYGKRDDVVGSYTGRLSNGGEELRLHDAAGTLILEIDYRDSDPWPVRADGVGASLEWVDPANTPVDQYDRADRWRASTDFGGSPGRDGSPPVGIVINEVLANTDPVLMLTDSIELYNTTDQTIDLSGWSLSDSRNQLVKYTIGPGTTLSAGAYLVLDESHFNPTPANPGPNDFALSGARGDDVWLVKPRPNETIDAFVDNVEFVASANGVSFGRLPNGQGRLTPQLERSLGEPNGEPLIGPVILSEIQYHPGPPSDAALQIEPTITNDDLEFLELHNTSNQTVDLKGWSLSGGVAFQFEQTLELAAGGTLLIVPFAPGSLQNASRLEAFRTHYGLEAAVPIVGGYAGQLRDRGELLQWLRPDLTGGVPAESAPQLLADEVLYDYLAPWPTTASGTGNSLRRVAASASGNSADSWRATAPTPGRVDSGGDLNDDGRMDSVDIDLICAALLSQDPPDALFDLNGDQVVDQLDHAHLVRSSIGTTFGDANVDGVFDSSDLVLIFQRGEYEDQQPGNSGWADGDWNCDGEFDSSDIVLAFREGGYVRASRPAHGPDK